MTNDHPYVTQSSGSQTLCNIKSVFVNFFFGLMTYSAALAIYYTLTVYFGWSRHTIALRVEPILHDICWLFPLTGGIASVAIAEISNPLALLPGICGFVDFPSGCSWNDNVDCKRGGTTSFHFAVFFGSVLPLASFVIIFVSFCLIYCKMRALEANLQQYTNAHNPSSSGVNRSASMSSVDSHRTSTKVGRQAMRYIGVFFACHAALIVLPLGRDSDDKQETRGNGVFFAIAILVIVMVPLQGFLNAGIFLTSNPSVMAPGGPLEMIGTRLRPPHLHCTANNHGQPRGDNHNDIGERIQTSNHENDDQGDTERST